MYKIECESLDKTIFDNINCEIKFLSRGVQILNFHFDILTIIEDDFIINLEITTKTSTNDFKNVFLNASMNVCGDVFASPIIQLVMPFVEKFAPGIIHKCPYGPEKNFGIQNFGIDSNLLSLFAFTINDRTSYKSHTTLIVKQKVVATLTIYTKVVAKRFGKKKSNSG